MGKRVQTKIRSLEETISSVWDQSRTLASLIDSGAYLSKDLQQTAVALYYELGHFADVLQNAGKVTLKSFY